MGITAKEQEKIALMKQLQGLNEAMGKIVDDINSNPNLPKGLAQRRIAEFQAQNKDVINQLLGSIEIVNAELGQLNDQLDFQLGILKDEEAARERQLNNSQQNLNVLISSGAIASMTDAELQNWANATGFSLKDLQSIKNASSKGNISFKDENIGGPLTHNNLLAEREPRCKYSTDIQVTEHRTL